jgi:hypothetical protein
MRRFFRRTALVLRAGLPAVVLAGVVASPPAFAEESQESVYSDQQVKAAFIYHFATFVEWPPLAGGRDTFRVAVLGDDGVAGELEESLPGRDIGGRQMQVQRLSSLDELDDADMLYIGAKYNHSLPKLISQVGDRAVLVVTDAPGALDDGSMINFQVVDERVRFEISLTAAERAGLAMSSRLLSAAMFVDTTSAIPPRGSAVMLADNAGAARSRGFGIYRAHGALLQPA